MDYDEPETFTTYCLTWRGTAAQCREVVLRVRASPEFLTWLTLDNLVTHGAFQATTPEGLELCQRLASADVALTSRAAKVLHEVTRTVQ